jgi:hypothetical protein
MCRNHFINSVYACDVRGLFENDFSAISYLTILNGDFTITGSALLSAPTPAHAGLPLASASAIRNGTFPSPGRMARPLGG